MTPITRDGIGQVFKEQALRFQLRLRFIEVMIRETVCVEPIINIRLEN